MADLNLMVENGDPVPNAFGGYPDGSFANAAQIQAKFPGMPVLKFTVSAADDEGHCLDIENGDAVPAQAPGWIVKRRAGGLWWASNYCSMDDYDEVWAAFVAAGVPQPFYIIADYDGNPIVYPMPMVIGHQLADRGPYDEGVLLPTYPLFPQPAPIPTEDDDMSPSPVFSSKPGQLDVVSVGGNRLWHKWSLNGGETWANEDVGNESVGGALAQFPNQKPEWSLIGGHFYITVDDNANDPWYFDQPLATGKWGVGKLP